MISENLLFSENDYANFYFHLTCVGINTMVFITKKSVNFLSTFSRLKYLFSLLIADCVSFSVVYLSGCKLAVDTEISHATHAKDARPSYKRKRHWPGRC